MKKKNTKKIIITGGHHTSALPVIKKLRSLNIDIDILWLGHKYSLKGDKNPSLEFIEISEMGIPFINLKAGKIYKNLDVFNLIKIPLSFFQALIEIIKFKPNVILSFGGYLSVPVVISGWILGVPVITHEQTVVVGYANKLVSIFARKILISWPSSEKYFPKDKLVFSGIPLRKEIFVRRSNAFNFENDLPVVFILGGKTGSHLINMLVLNNIERMLSICNIIHQTGDNSVHEDYSKLINKYEEIKNVIKGRYYVRKFILEDEIGEAYKKSTLVVSRSGAHTLAELLILEKPSLLIPIPWVSHNEQNENAKFIKKVGLSEILEEKNIIPVDFYDCIKTMLINIHQYKLNDPSIQKFIKQDSTDIICNEILKLIYCHNTNEFILSS